MAAVSAPATPRGPLVLETISDGAGFEALASEWDDLVLAMPRPSPYLLHVWLSEWWRVHGTGCRLAVHVARRRGRLVGALPLFVERRHGIRTARFLGGKRSMLADVLVARGEDGVAPALVERAGGPGQDLVDLVGLPGGSRLAACAGGRVKVVERVEAPVLDLDDGWRRRTLSKATSTRLARKRRRLAEAGRLELATARTAGELEAVVDDTLRLHALRWQDRPDLSGVLHPDARRFYRAVYPALAERNEGVFRVVRFLLDGRSIAYHAHFVLDGSLYWHRLGFDPAYARFSPGLLLILEVLDRARSEGVRRVEFLGGGEAYKLHFADQFEPLYEGYGLAATARGRGLAALYPTAVRLRRRLKGSARLRSAYLRTRAALLR